MRDQERKMKNDNFIIGVLFAIALIASIFTIVSLYIEQDTHLQNISIEHNNENHLFPTITCSYLNNTFAVAHFNIPWSYYNKNEYKYFVNSSYNGEHEILDPKSGYITIASSNKDEYMSIVAENINNGNRTIMIYTKCEGEYK